MRRLTVRVAIGFLTFIVGVITSTAWFSFHRPRLTPQLPARVDQVFVETEPEELLPPPEDTNAERISDLSIVIEASEPIPHPPSHSRRYIKLAKSGTATVDLDLAEDINNQEVTLNYRDHSAQYRMFQRYRTSMTIALEGPHLDLLDWRHFDSPWIELQSLDTMRFRTLATEQMNDSRFPSTSKPEIIKEVRRHAGKDWGADPTELVKDCDGPNDLPCLITISSIYLRIQKKVRASWIDVGLVEIRIPMGC